jgi:beta-glucanase (GH16 family)
MKRFCFSTRAIVSCAAAIAFSAALVDSAAAEVPDVPGWEIVWHDEFDGTAVNEQNWDVLTRRNSFNNEKQYYVPEQASIVDGKLRITATNQPLDGKAYRSARLESWQTYGPGRFEARIDLPTTKGMWPAFWLLPRAKTWPTGGEIDILENRGSEPLQVSSAYHWQVDPSVPCCSQHQFVFENYTTTDNGTPVNFHSGFHTYAVEWEATQLRFYVDGVLHYTVRETASRPIFENPMNIILNLAVGGDFGGDPNATTVFPQHMDVDYVRVWQRQTGLSGDYNSDGRVDAADYVIWRKTNGAEGIGLAADGSGNGTVNEDDYLVWRQIFGATTGAAGSAATVPEPYVSSLVAVALCRAFVARAYRRPLQPGGMPSSRNFMRARN